MGAHHGRHQLGDLAQALRRPALHAFAGHASGTGHPTFNSIVHANGAFYDEWKNRGERRETSDPAHRLNVYYNGTVGRLGIDFNADYYTSGNTSRSHTEETSRMQEDRVVNSENRVRNRLAASKLILSYPVLG